MNKVILSGRTTADIELRTTPGGKSVVNFTLAVNEGFGDKQKTNFIDCVAWQKQAEVASQYVRKGDRVNIVGRLQTRIYEKDGRKVKITEVIADEIEFIESKRSESAGGTGSTPAGGEVQRVPDAYTEAPKFEEIPDEELPF